jgi:hypothetical protein
MRRLQEGLYDGATQAGVEARVVTLSVAAAGGRCDLPAVVTVAEVPASAFRAQGGWALHLFPAGGGYVFGIAGHLEQAQHLDQDPIRGTAPPLFVALHGLCGDSEHRRQQGLGAIESAASRAAEFGSGHRRLASHGVYSILMGPWIPRGRTRGAGVLRAWRSHTRRGRGGSSHGVGQSRYSRQGLRQGSRQGRRW